MARRLAALVPVALGLFLTLAAPAPLRAATTFTVNTTDSTNDGVCEPTHCSLHDAIGAANMNPGADVIEFAIPGGGVKTLNPGPLMGINDAVTINGYTQPGAQANTTFEGALDSVIMIEIVGQPFLVGPQIMASGVTIRGLSIYGYQTNLQITDTVTGVVIAGNYIGTAANGSTIGTSDYGITCGLCAGVTIGGPDPADRNLISGNTNTAIDAHRPADSTPRNLTINGNVIGLNRTATAAVPNGIGIYVSSNTADASASDVLAIAPVGMAMVPGNVISGNTSHGIVIERTAGADISSQCQIFANRIGTVEYEGAATNFGNGGVGVLTDGAIKCLIQANRVAYNSRGFVIKGPLASGSGVYVSSNSIFDNIGLGIDLGDDGRTANDADDSDNGANGLLNFPVLTSAGTDPDTGIVTITGTLQAPANRTLIVEFRTNGVSSRPNGYDAKGVLGSKQVTTDINGFTTFSFTSLGGTPVAPGDKVVGLTHDSSSRRHTSEISDAIAAAIAPPAITGTVTAPGGIAMSNVEVTLTGTETRTATTGSSGSYAFTNLTVGGDYTVTADVIGYTFTPPSKSFTNVTSSKLAYFQGTPVPAIYTVNVAHDNGDGPCTVGECTLREAIEAANSHPGADNIAFNIPGAGPHVLEIDASMPALNSDLVVDGYTQPGAFPNANATGGLNGSLKIALRPGTSYTGATVGLGVSGSRVTVRGLAIGGFMENLRVIQPITAPRDVLITGNYLGTTADGLAAVAGNMVGLSIGNGTGVTIGGTAPAARNLISGNEGIGLGVGFGAQLEGANVVVQGNLIGTDATGQTALPNVSGVVFLGFGSQASLMRIGGDAPGEGNVISGNGTGIVFDRGYDSAPDAADHQTIGNLIGVAADGTTPLGNTDAGVTTHGAISHRLIRNTIANNGGSGVLIDSAKTDSGRGIELIENRIFGNTWLNINLDSDPSFKQNDPGDPDDGPNGYQNHPELTGMIESLAGTTLSGTLDSLPNRTYRIEVFSTGDALVGIRHHAREFVGSFTVTTGPDGIAQLSHVFNHVFAVTEHFVATATDVDARMTSELSLDVEFTPDVRTDVTVTVTMDGAPLSGVDIAVTGDRQVTQQTVNGARIFSLPVGGSFVLTPTLAGYVFTPESAPVANLAAPVTVAFTARRATFTRYLPEGATGGFWKTAISLLNSNAIATTAELSFLLQDGTRKTLSVPMGGPSHVVIDPATIEGLESTTFSTVVSSQEPLTVSRTMRWGDQGQLGAHAEQALNEPRTSWVFAEGSTGCFDLFYLLVNPGATKAEVDITFVRPAPLAPIVKHYQVGAFSRATIAVNQEDGLDASEVSARIDVANGQPIVAERAMYARCFGETWRGGHDAVASPAASTDWFFAEGATGSFFDMYLLLANFETQDAAVDVTYLLEGGATITKPHVVPAGSRLTIDVRGEAPELDNAAVSTIVHASNAVPVAAERAQWWPRGAWYEAHVSAGVTQTGVEWEVAGAEVGGLTGAEAFLLIANTSSTVGSAQVRVIYDDGTSEVLPSPLTLDPNSRTTVSLRSAFPATADRVSGVVVESLGGSPVPIVVELSTYGNTPAVGTSPFRFWGAGTNMVATRVR